MIWQVLIHDCSDEDLKSIIPFAPLGLKLTRCLEALRCQADYSAAEADTLSSGDVYQGLMQVHILKSTFITEGHFPL